MMSKAAPAQWRACTGPLIAAACRGLAVKIAIAVAAAGMPGTTTAEPRAAGESLALREQQLAGQFRELERSFLRLADLLAASDPRRATLLRNVFEQGRDAEMGDRLDTIVRLLEENKLLKAGTSQADAIDKLKELLALLEAGDADPLLKSTKDEVKRFIARVAKLIAKQRDIDGSTEAGADDDDLAAREEALAEETRGLAGDIGGFAKRMEPRETDQSEQDGKEAAPKDGDGTGKKPSAEEQGEGQSKEGQSGEEGESAEGGGGEPSDEDQGDDEASRARRTRKRLQAAEDRMRKARQQLEESRRKESRQEQEKAIEELETARAELEEILRQMREEEVERLLVQLETRIRGMLRAERAVLAGAEKLAAEPGGQAGRERELEAARLGREQTAVGNDATKALALVRDDGSAVAIPQALEQIRDDSLQAAARLQRGDVGSTTRGILGDIVASLEEMLAALERAQREQQAKKENPSGGRPAEPGEQPLVDKLAELKMIRSLQMRVNGRTKRFSQLIAAEAEQADEPALRQALERLAERQRAIQQAAHDIVTGRTE
jgi:hypothetical protein